MTMILKNFEKKEVFIILDNCSTGGVYTLGVPTKNGYACGNTSL